MLKKLFGGGEKPKAAPVVAAKADPAKVAADLEKQKEMMEKRENVLANKIEEHKQNAVNLKKANKTQAAVKEMKMMKMQQKEMTKLQGMTMMIVEQ